MEQKKDESFGKEYKCCSKKDIDLLFEKKQIVKVYPFVLYHYSDNYSFNKAFQIVISVPKKKFKKAVHRNRIKRIIKEVIRKNKYILEDALFKMNKKISLFLIYTANEELKYVILNDKIKVLFSQLLKENKINEFN